MELSLEIKTRINGAISWAQVIVNSPEDLSEEVKEALFDSGFVTDEEEELSLIFNPQRLRELGNKLDKVFEGLAKIGILPKQSSTITPNRRLGELRSVLSLFNFEDYVGPFTLIDVDELRTHGGASLATCYVYAVELS